MLKKILCTAGVVLLMAFSSAQAIGFDADKTITGAEIYKKFAPSVVLIVGKNSLGSGVILNNNMILTNWHVIKDNSRVKIAFKPKNDSDPNEKLLSADGIAIRYNQVKDLALVMVENIPETLLHYLPDNRRAFSLPSDQVETTAELFLDLFIVKNRYMISLSVFTIKPNIYIIFVCIGIVIEIRNKRINHVLIITSDNDKK